MITKRILSRLILLLEYTRDVTLYLSLSLSLSFSLSLSLSVSLSLCLSLPLRSIGIIGIDRI